MKKKNNFEKNYVLFNFGQLSCTIRYGVCVIKSFHSSQWILFHLYTHAGDILQICIWLFDGD